ncbi:MAG: transcription termination/antitermination protein NusG [Puniceicoccales bacterium]|jgi:transcriptional antiterminator NusG|nr:transcription termination/antitermination protein NusG [Puniceicoccales bacterium]
MSDTETILAPFSADTAAADIAADPPFEASEVVPAAEVLTATNFHVAAANSRADFRWYAIQTLSNMEGRVKKYLDKFIEKDEMGEFFLPPPGRPLTDRVLMPTETVSERKNNRTYTKVRKLYPNYMFLQMRLYDDQGKVLQKPWYFVNNVQGVINFIGGNEPVPLKPEEIQRILKQVAEAEGKVVPSKLYNVGENVKVTEGPFANMTGIIEAVDVERAKLHVSVSIFGRFTPVELDYGQVERTTED